MPDSTENLSTIKLENQRKSHLTRVKWDSTNYLFAEINSKGFSVRVATHVDVKHHTELLQTMVEVGQDFIHRGRGVVATGNIDDLQA